MTTLSVNEVAVHLPPFNELAELAFREFLSRLSKEQFDAMSSPTGGTTLSVTVRQDTNDILRALKYGAWALAKECRRREFTAFAVPGSPSAIERREVLHYANIAMRICKAWDVMKGQMLIRLEVIGSCELPEVESRPY